MAAAKGGATHGLKINAENNPIKKTLTVLPPLNLDRKLAI